LAARWRFAYIWWRNPKLPQNVENTLKLRPLLLLLASLLVPGLSGLTGGALAPGAAWAKPEVVAARLGETPERTRFVLELSEDLPYRVFTLPDPFRVVLDLPEVAWTLPQGEEPKPTGLITGLRFGLFAPGTSRVVLDVSGPVLLQKVFIIPPREGKPHRLVVDIEPATRQQYFAAGGSATGEAAVSDEPLPSLRDQQATLPPGVPPLPQPKPADARPVVVIDPGHGGVDPGAVGVSGVYEKNLTLDYGLALKRALEATGRYRVVMTRDKDLFLKLRERIRVAQEAKGDLFISLHANVHASGKIRGASIYTLSETASDKEAAALAAAENAADVLAGVDLTDQTGDVRNILIDLAQRETMNLSKKFANDLVQEVGQETKLLRNTHRFAGFAVLKSPVVPSVLFEIGYMSNRQEERLLRDPSHRSKIIDSIIRATDGYFERQKAASRT
jgi:N-acetylmuramoyl-L-alanine amidase